MKNKELLPCPFCGSEAEVEQIPGAIYDEFVAHCENLKCIAFYIGYLDEGIYSTEEEAIVAWNTRKNKIPVGSGENYEVTHNENTI